MRIALLSLFVTITCLATAQTRRANHWYFGSGAGIDFSGGQPVADTQSKMEAIEGSSVISDPQGRLRFYTNGEVLFDRDHKPTPNSAGLIGDLSSSQSSLLVPLPRDTTAYYLFTSQQAGRSGLYYSVIDTRLRNGAGDIGSTKNIRLREQGTEELSGTLHCNGEYYWIVSRRASNDSIVFDSYLLGRLGLGLPVVSGFRTPYPVGNTVGSMIFSQDGTKMCFTAFGIATHIFSFDRQKGTLALLDTIARLDPDILNYSAVFSPDASKVYLSAWMPGGNCNLIQYDLSAPGRIEASATILDTVNYRLGSPNGYGFIGQLRLAPDGRIYSSRWHQERATPNSFYSLDTLDAILAPDQPGLACNYKRRYLPLLGRPTMLGLPNFISTFTTSPQASECNALKVAQPGVETELFIVPNPSREAAQILFGRDLHDARLRICNTAGQLVHDIRSVSGPSLQLNTSLFPAGLYFVNLILPDGSRSTEKLTVVR